MDKNARNSQENEARAFGVDELIIYLTPYYWLAISPNERTVNFVSSGQVRLREDPFAEDEGVDITEIPLGQFLLEKFLRNP
jgi:hypothetical protein